MNLQVIAVMAGVIRENKLAGMKRRNQEMPFLR